MRVAINGFGRIGAKLAERILGESRRTGRHAASSSEVRDVARDVDLEIAAINEPEPARHAQLREWLTTCDAARATVALSVPEPRELPWDALDVDVVVEASRWFHRDQMAAQTRAGRIPVIMTGDLRDSRPDLTLVLGVNHERYSPHHRILCAGSDRTQAFAPLLALLEHEIGIESYRLAVRRPPYAEVVGRVYANPRQAEQLSDVIPTLHGRGAVTRIEDPRATYVHAWCDVSLRRDGAEEELHDLLSCAESRFPSVLARTSAAVEPSGDVRSLLVDKSSLRCGERRVWFEAAYDPITSYAERLVEMLRFVTRATRDA